MKVCHDKFYDAGLPISKKLLRGNQWQIQLSMSQECFSSLSFGRMMHCNTVSKLEYVQLMTKRSWDSNPTIRMNVVSLRWTFNLPRKCPSMAENCWGSCTASNGTSQDRAIFMDWNTPWFGNLACIPLISTVNHPKIIKLNQMEQSISIQSFYTHKVWRFII